jgi:hypothetical protein
LPRPGITLVANEIFNPYCQSSFSYAVRGESANRSGIARILCRICPVDYAGLYQLKFQHPFDACISLQCPCVQVRSSRRSSSIPAADHVPLHREYKTQNAIKRFPSRRLERKWWWEAVSALARVLGHQSMGVNLSDCLFLGELIAIADAR